MASPSESNSVTIDDSLSPLGVKSYQAVLLPIYELLALLSELKEPHLSLKGLNYPSLLKSSLECISSVQSSLSSLHKLIEGEALRTNRNNYVSDDEFNPPRLPVKKSGGLL